MIISVFDIGNNNAINSNSGNKSQAYQPYLILTSKSLSEKCLDHVINSVFIHPLTGYINVLTERYSLNCTLFVINY
jgi:hypothetical protein